ncbi:unnamed protein product [Camellia sinensis]
MIITLHFSDQIEPCNLVLLNSDQIEFEFNIFHCRSFIALGEIEIKIKMGFSVTSLIFVAIGFIVSLCTRICYNKGPSANLEKDRECGEASPRMSRIMALYSHGGTVPETQREITDLLSLSISTRKRLRALAMRHARRTACASAYSSSFLQICTFTPKQTQLCCQQIMVPPNIGYYCNSMLLDDVGNCVSCTDETAHSPNFERRGVRCYQQNKSNPLAL